MNFLSPESLLTFLGGVIAALITVFATRGKSLAEAGKATSEGEATLSQATMAWATQIKATLEERIATVTTDYTRQISGLQVEYGERLSNMSARITALETENRLYRQYTGLLIGQIREAGMVPVSQPPHPEGHSY
jgi:hypothetical protein